MKTCTKPEKIDLRHAELKELLLVRAYPESLIDRPVEKAKKITRKVALTKIIKNITEKGPIFALKYDPRLPSVPQILARHWRAMVFQDAYLKECFQKPPLTALSKQPNLRNLLKKKIFLPS